MSNLTITARINALLAEQGKSKKEFYEACHLTSSSYSQWKTGKTKPRFSSLQVVAEYLGTTVAYLIGEDSNPHGSSTHWANLADPANDELIDYMQGQKETPTTKEGDERQELYRLFTSASQERRDIVMAILRNSKP